MEEEHIGGGSSTGSMSTVSKDESSHNNLVVGESSSSDGESELELGLSLGGGPVKSKASSNASWVQSGRILTAKDFPSMLPSSSSFASSSSSASSSCLSRLNVFSTSTGTKRSADSVVSPNGSSGQVVGWPPIRAYRMNSLNNQSKSPPRDGPNSKTEKTDGKSTVVEKVYGVNDKSSNNLKAKGHAKTSFFVKVNMDGVLIGRKVDLRAHSSYDSLAQTLEEMFQRPTSTVNAMRSCSEEYDMMAEATGRSKLLDGSSEFVLTYEDKDGDWMLVGDVPWGMFLSSVRRLRIMRTSEATGLAPSLQQRNGRP